MGIHDRHYYSDNIPDGLAPSWNKRSIVANIIIVNVVLFLANMIVGDNSVTKALTLHSDNLKQPWMWWRFLSYAFAHDPESIFHILFNMFSLYSLGRAVEERYGRWEFLCFYLLSAIAGGLVHAVLSPNPVLGASGAVCAVIMLFVFNYPKVPLSIWGVISVPAWVLGAMLVALNIFSSDGVANGDEGSRVAFDVHLAGIGFAAAYFYLGWNLSSWLNADAWRRMQRRLTGPRLKVHKPSNNREEEEADRILQKIHEKGQDSLTKAEKKFMQKYSRSVRQRRSADVEP